jgi:hypothetical protein
MQFVSREAASGPSLHYYRLRVPAPATWTSPDGEDRSGTIEVAPGTPAGASVEIWTDAAGRLSQAPPADDVLVRRGAVTGLATFAAVAFAAFLAHAMVRRHLDRARHRRWDEEWAIVEPVWSRRVR